MPEIQSPDFQKAKKNRIFQDVIEQIQEAIFSRKLNPGDLLPPERELRECFNISRGTLREALRVLEHKGLIEIKVGTGGGSVIKHAGVEQLTESIALLIRSRSLSLFDIGEFREGMEGKIAWLASKRADNNDIARLKKLLSLSEAAVKQGLSAWGNFIDVDQKIHKELALISKNSLYTYTSQVIHDNIGKYYDKYLDKTLNRMKENLQDLQDIVSSVENHMPEKAAMFAEKHVHRFNIRMREKETLSGKKALLADHPKEDGL
ncbi:MAG: GntR family transcriptional regulator [Thermodesulfobacteriota bacterium]|nr:GntR family transcriptional regulator [Thermodesulfobacteriota bacterium]